MALKFNTNQRVTMPPFFGPAYSQNPKASQCVNGHFKPAEVDSISITYETDDALLENCIPECYRMREPLITVNVCEFNRIGWLNGKSYRLINVNCPVHFKGELDDCDGDLVLAMFENHCDPIVGGRELMGYSKLYCDIPPIQFNGKKYISIASCWDFQFMKITVDTNEAPSELERVEKTMVASQGKMHLKVFTHNHSRDEERHISNEMYPTMLPLWKKPNDYPWEMIEPKTEWGNGTIEWNAPSWEDWPTNGHVAVGLAKLPVCKILAAKHCVYSDPCEYGDIFRLK